MFVFCLCQESDVANQWFTYADQGRGFELGFDLGPLNGLSEDVEKREQLDQVISEVIETIEAMPVPDSAAAVDDLVRRAGSMAVGELLEHWIRPVTWFRRARFSSRVLLFYHSVVEEPNTNIIEATVSVAGACPRFMLALATSAVRDFGWLVHVNPLRHSIPVQQSPQVVALPGR
jgi:hypothetical protein